MSPVLGDAAGILSIEPDNWSQQAEPTSKPDNTNLQVGPTRPVGGDPRGSESDPAGVLAGIWACTEPYVITK